MRKGWLIRNRRSRARPAGLLPLATTRVALVERAWGLYVDAGVACVRLQGRDPAGRVVQDRLVPANGELAAVVTAELDAMARFGALPPLYLTGKLAAMIRSTVGRGTIFPPAAAAWLGARALMRRTENAGLDALALVELSASGYLVLGVDRAGELKDDLLVVNPRCGAGSGVNLDRVLQKLGMAREELDCVLAAYLGEAGNARRRAVLVRADRCGVFSSSATISDKNQGIPLDMALAVTVKSEVLKACRKLPAGFAKVVLAGRIFEWAYARDCATDYLQGQGVREVAAEPGNGFVIDALHDLVARVGADAIGQPDERVKRHRAALEYPSFRALRRAYEADHRFLRLPDPASEPWVDARPVLIGLDVGSTMAKVAVADAQTGAILHLAAYSNSGDTIESVKRIFEALRDRAGDTLAVRGIGVTGSARYQVQQALEHVYPTLAGRLAMLVENYAHARGSIDCAREHLRRLKAAGVAGVREDLCILVDIGGEDTKISTIALAQAELFNNAMNLKCSAGTGSLMDTLTAMFSMPSVAAACAEAFEAPRARQINATCAVFLMENARKLQAEGVPRAEILAAANWAIVENMARSLWNQVELPAECVVLLQGQTMLSEPLPLAVTHRLQSHVRGRAFALVPPNPGHRACFGLIRTQQQTALQGQVQIDLRRLIDMQFDKRITVCRGAACSDEGASCNRAKLTCRDADGARMFSFTLGGCSAVNELIARKKLGIAPEAVRDTYKEIWDFIDQRHPRSDDPRRLIIPRSFCVSEWAFLFADLLGRLGVPVHVDNVLAADLLEAQPLFHIDSCAPQMGAVGQFRRLAGLPHGMILAPQIEYLPTGGASLGRTCTINQGGIAVAVSYARQLHPQARMHLFNVDLGRLEPDALCVQLEERLQPVFEPYGLAPTPTELRAAVAGAIEAHQRLKRDAAGFAAGLIEQALDQGVRVALVVGREYVLNPGLYDSHVRRLLADKHMVAIPSYVLDVELDPDYAHIYWRNPHAIVTILDAVARRRLHERVRHPRLAALFKRIESGADLLPVVQVSTFTCGPDSVTAPFVAEIMKRRPFLLIQSDAVLKELAHLENRVNTYIKQLELGLHGQLAGGQGPPFEVRMLGGLRSDRPLDPRNDVVYVPTLADNRGMTAALRGAGFACIDNYAEDYDLHALVKEGRKATGDAVCAPLAAVYGDLLRAVADFERRRNAGDPLVAGRRRLVYFDNKGLGPCRQGQYVEVHELLALRDRGPTALRAGPDCGPLGGQAVLQFAVGAEGAGYNFGVEEWVMVRIYLGVVLQAVLQALYFRGAECRDHAEFERFLRDYEALRSALYRELESFHGPGAVWRRALRLAEGTGRLETALKYFAFDLYGGRLRRLLRGFARRWTSLYEVSDHRLEVAIGGEVYMRVAQAEEIFRALLADLGFRRLRVAVTPIWSYAEYLLDEAAELGRDAMRRAESAKRQGLRGHWDSELREARRVQRRCEGWRFVLRRLLAGPLYAAAGLPLPPSTRPLLDEARAILPTLRPIGELVTYIGEAVTELRGGSDIVLNVAPQGCMVSSMGELLTPAIEGLQSQPGRGRIQHLFSAEGDVNEELLTLAVLKSLGPERYLRRAAV
ncbi:MAG: acyl-CoA dehydratase activase-related protein [Aquincola sp.]|nr:acyl-CoA dehydratase activase-related protein [Aquincola sp.]